MTDWDNNLEVKGGDLLAKVSAEEFSQISVPVKKSWQSFLQFWRKPGLPATRENLSLATKVAGLPAVLLGALFFLALINTDLAYWNKVVNAGTDFVSVPTKVIDYAYTKITSPLDLALEKLGVSLVQIEKKDYLAQVGGHSFGGTGWKKKTGLVLAKMSFGEDELIRKIQNGSRIVSLAFKDKSSQFLESVSSGLNKVRGNLKSSLPLGVGEKISRRKEILASRADNFKTEISNLGSQSLALVGTNYHLNFQKLETSWSQTGHQVAAVWNSKILNGLEKSVNSYQEAWNNLEQKLFSWLGTLDEKLVWLENLPVRFRQKVSSLWTASLIKANEIATNWSEFLNPKKEISPEDLEEIKKAVTEEISKNLNDQVIQTTSGRSASYGAVVVPSSGEAVSDEQIKKNLRNQFSDDVSIKFDKSGQAGVITPIFENDERGDDYVFLLTPINK